MPRSSEPSRRPMVSVAVRYWLAWRTIRSRMRFLAHPVSRTVRPAPMAMRTRTMKPTKILAIVAKTERRRRSAVTSYDGTTTCLAVLVVAVRTHQLKQPIEVERLLEERDRIESAGAVLI